MRSTGPKKDLGDLRYGFCIAGTQKSGTSSLSALLDEHRNVRRAPKKEMHYFDDEERDWSTGDFSDFTVPRRSRAHRIVGDATPLYLWWPQAMQRIHAYNPDMKMIAIFRDPIERLFSQWAMVVSRWPKVARDWPEFINEFRPPGLEDRIPEGVHIGGWRMRSGVVRGYYGEQLERGFSLFGADRFHLLEFRAFLADYRPALDRLTEFLEIPPFTEHPPLPHSMQGKPQVVGTAPTGEDIAGLVETYRDDFAKFKELSKLDVSRWPTQRLIAGELDPAELAAQYAKKVVAPNA